MSQGPLCPNLSQKFQAKIFQMANHNLSCVILLGGLSVNLNHLKRARLDIAITEVRIATQYTVKSQMFVQCDEKFMLISVSI